MSDVEVILSTHLARFAADEARFRVPGGTCRQVIDQVYERHPSLRQRLSDQSGKILPFISVYVGEENIRDLPSLDVEVDPRDAVTIMSAIAGG